jgi:two-component system cell cycle response regulator
MLVEDHQLSASRIMETLSQEQTVELVADPQQALLPLRDGDYDLLMMSLTDRDGLRLCSQVRSLDRIRHLPILIITEPGDDARLLLVSTWV